jgi:succinate-semialdehyde dehydrogenase/glutarate-semialdehyde dehydrogenase
LGGNDPFIVLEDADLDAAVAGAMIAKTRSGGQACTAANRFLVDESIADDFAARLADAMSRLRVGSPRAEETELGPMINARAVDGIADKVERSVDAGAKVRLGGSPLDGPGYYYPPTVLSDVPPDCATATEEIFGPVAPVISVRDDTEAVRLANATDMGLAAYVYSGSLGRALSLAEQLESGMIAINRGALSDAAAPFGGVKQSGLGREGGSEGILAYLETVYLALSY